MSYDYIVEKEKLYVYVYGKDAEKVIMYSTVLVETKNIEEADFILASTKINPDKKIKNSKKPIIGMKYFLLKDENVIGAIFWHKGRPNIVFIRKRLKKFKIEPPKVLEKYIEDRVW
jgi:hydroxymethylpyrimidine/phosphomethylpyrimidine kinase